MILEGILTFLLHNKEAQADPQKESLEIEKTRIRYCKYVNNWDDQVCHDLKSVKQKIIKKPKT